MLYNIMPHPQRPRPIFANVMKGYDALWRYVREETFEIT